MLGLSKLIVLSVLREGSLHGYGIIRAIETRTNQCCSITAGSIYPLLAQLKKEKLVIDHKTVVSGRERTNYDLTDAGKNTLKEGLDMWEIFINNTKGILSDGLGVDPIEA